jgi:hypothetical protein
MPVDIQELQSYLDLDLRGKRTNKEIISDILKDPSSLDNKVMGFISVYYNEGMKLLNDILVEASKAEVLPDLLKSPGIRNLLEQIPNFDRIINPLTEIALTNPKQFDIIYQNLPEKSKTEFSKNVAEKGGIEALANIALLNPKHYSTIYDNLPKKGNQRENFTEEVVKKGGKELVDVYQERDLLSTVATMTLGTVGQKVGLQGKNFHKDPQLLQEAKLEVMYNVLEELSARIGKPLIEYERYPDNTINANGKKTILLDAKTIKQIDSFIGETIKQSASDINKQIDTLAKADGKNPAKLSDDQRSDYLLQAMQQTAIAKFNKRQQDSLGGEHPLNKLINTIQSATEEKIAALQPAAEKENKAMSFIKSLVSVSRKAALELNEKDRNTLIDNFRNAVDGKELAKAAKEIVKYEKSFENEHKHFLITSKNISRKITNGEVIDPVDDKRLSVGSEPDPQGNLRLTKEEFESYKKDLENGKTQSLQKISNVKSANHFNLSGDNNQIGTNFLNGKYKNDKPNLEVKRQAGGDFERGVDNGVLKFLKDVRSSMPENNQPSTAQMNALAEVIVQKYPLTMHLLNPNRGKDTLNNDRGVLLTYGSDIRLKDPEYIQRWEARTKLKAEFSDRMADFIKKGMNDPEKMEQYMQDCSNQVAEMYKKDLQTTPDKTTKAGEVVERTYGAGANLTQQAAIAKIVEHQNELKLNKGKSHLTKALAEAKSSELKIEDAQAKDKQPTVVSQTAKLKKEESKEVKADVQTSAVQPKKEEVQKKSDERPSKVPVSTIEKGQVSELSTEVNKREKKAPSFLKSIATELRKATLGLNKKERNELIDNFRNAKDDASITQAAQDIVKYKKNFDNKYSKHFLDVATRVVTRNETGKKPIDFYKIDKDQTTQKKVEIPDKERSSKELLEFMENLKLGKVKSLNADLTNVMISNTTNSININFVFDDKSNSALVRAQKGVKDFLNEINGTLPDKSKSNLQQIEAVHKVIFEKYPLTSHLINTANTVSNNADRSALMQFGSYFMEQDKGFAQRWQDHNKLKVEFTAKLKEFVEGGMKNPDEFEKYMQETSRKVAEIYKKDVAIMPKNANQPYGGKSREEALQKLDKHVNELKSTDQHLSQALKEAKNKQVEAETVHAKDERPVVGSQTAKLKREGSASVGKAQERV